MREYLTAREAAQETGIAYFTLLARIRKGTVKAEMANRTVLIHRDEVIRVKKDALGSKAVEETTR